MFRLPFLPRSFVPTMKNTFWGFPMATLSMFSTVSLMNVPQTPRLTMLFSHPNASHHSCMLVMLLPTKTTLSSFNGRTLNTSYLCSLNGSAAFIPITGMNRHIISDNIFFIACNCPVSDIKLTTSAGNKSPHLFDSYFINLLYINFLVANDIYAFRKAL